jgi:DNA-binding LacI/PurR family transcriptional regulator
MLVAAIDEGERPSVKMTLKPELIVRQSTQCVSAAKG